MPLIDDRGRLFGRINLIDAAVLLAVGVLIPLMYGAYLLFQPDPPRLLGVTPAQIEPGTLRVEVKGEHFRPALRVRVGTFATRFLMADPETGIVELPPQLEPGSYDLFLLDEAEVIQRLPGALSVVAPPPSVAELVAIGSFEAPSAAQAQTVLRRIQALRRDTRRQWEVLGVAAPVRVVSFLFPQRPDAGQEIRAVLRFRCQLLQQQCTAFDVILSPGAVVPVPLDARGTVAPFRIAELHPVYTEGVEVTLRTSVTTEELPRFREWLSADERLPAEAALQPFLESLTQLGVLPNNKLSVSLRVRVPAVATPRGWMCQGRLLTIGARLELSRRDAVLSGRIVEIGPAVPLRPS